MRKLAHREPVPRRAMDRVRFVATRLSKFPMIPILSLGTMAFLGLFYRYLAASDYFAISEIGITPATRVSEDTLRGVLASRAAVAEGSSLLSVSDSLAEQAVLSLPAVRHVSVSKHWPNRLEVTLSERLPVGILVCRRGSYVFDTTGRLFARTTPDDFRRVTRPVLTVGAAASAHVGDMLPEGALRTWQTWNDVFQRGSESLYSRLSELHIDEEGALTVIFDDGGSYYCGYKAPAEVGPVIETLLKQVEAGDEEPLEFANLASPYHATVKRRNRAAEKLEAQIASKN